MIGKNINQIISVSEQEGLHIVPEAFPYMLTMQMKEKATSVQMTRWIKLCRKMLDKCTHPEIVKPIKNFFDELEVK